MVGQTQVEDVGDPTPQTVPNCSWCSADGTERLVVRDAVWGYHPRTGVKVEKKPAVSAPACKGHFDHFEEQKAQARAEKERIRAEKRARRKS